MAAAGALRPLVEFIRDVHASTGATTYALAALVGEVIGEPVSAPSIGRVLAGDTYPDEPGPTRRKRSMRSPRHMGPGQVRALRLAYWTTEEPAASIAKRFGLSRSYAIQVAGGRARTDVPMPRISAAQRVQRPLRRSGQRSRGVLNWNAQFTWSDVDTMRQVYWSAEAEPAALAEEYETSVANVWMITNNRRWRLPETEFQSRYVRGSARSRRRQAA